MFHAAEKAVPPAMIIGHGENSAWYGVIVAWYRSIKYLKNMSGFSGHNGDGLCVLNQINGVLPFSAGPTGLICPASLRVTREFSSKAQ